MFPNEKKINIGILAENIAFLFVYLRMNHMYNKIQIVRSVYYIHKAEQK